MQVACAHARGATRTDTGGAAISPLYCRLHAPCRGRRGAGCRGHRGMREHGHLGACCRVRWGMGEHGRHRWAGARAPAHRRRQARASARAVHELPCPGLRARPSSGLEQRGCRGTTGSTAGAGAARGLRGAVSGIRAARSPGCDRLGHKQAARRRGWSRRVLRSGSRPPGRDLRCTAKAATLRCTVV